MRDEWYWCLHHERVERADEVCPADRRLGPYPTKVAAANWRDAHDQHEAEWEAEERAWDDDGGGLD